MLDVSASRKRWPLLVIVLSMVLLVVSIWSKAWILGDDLRAGLWSRDWTGGDHHYGHHDSLGLLPLMGLLTGGAAVLSCVLLLIVLVNEGGALRWVAVASISLTVALALGFISATVDHATTWPGYAFSVFLVGSMGAVIGASALEAASAPTAASVPTAEPPGDG